MNHNISIAKTTIEEWDDEVKICLNSAFYCIKEAWNDMCANQWGRVINITSVAAVLGGVGQSSYGSAKARLISLCKTVALEGARYNITGNCVLIGISETDAYHKLPEAVQQKVEQMTVHKKPASGHRQRRCLPRLGGGLVHDGCGHEYAGRSRPFSLLAIFKTIRETSLTSYALHTILRGSLR